jgi:MinD-like ATPase involved in chromosome partitioning or flagellar assembly
VARIISIHSFRGGTGKSNTAANLAAVLAADGQRVGVIDTDIQSPGIHILFGLAGEMMNLASAGIFVLRYPDHPLTALYRQVAAQLIR